MSNTKAMEPYSEASECQEEEEVPGRLCILTDNIKGILFPKKECNDDGNKPLREHDIFTKWRDKFSVFIEKIQKVFKNK